MLNPRLKYSGMAYCSHSKYKGMLVVVYAAAVGENRSGSCKAKPTPEPIQPIQPTKPTKPTQTNQIVKNAYLLQNKVRTEPRKIARIIFRQYQ